MVVRCAAPRGRLSVRRRCASRWVTMVLVAQAACLSAPGRSTDHDGAVDPGAGEPGGHDTGPLPDPWGKDLPHADPGGKDAPPGDFADPGTQDPGAADLDAGPGEPDPGPGCPSFAIKAFGIAGGKTHVRHGETAQVVATVESHGETPTLDVTVSPPAMAASFQGDGHGGGTFRFDAPVDQAFRTTPVTFTLKAAAGGCTLDRTATLKVLGTVWVTERGSDVVQVFRSDGVFIGQGIPSGLLDDPWSLLELAPDRILVGSRYNPGAEIYDLQGEHVGSFDTEDSKGQILFSVYGAYTTIRHQPDGLIWVGGPRGVILVFDDQGHYQKTIYLEDYTIEAESLMQRPDGTTVLVYDSTLPWSMVLLDKDGQQVQKFGNNSNELELDVFRAALAGDRILVGGQAYGKGYLARLKLTGTLVDHSGPIADFKPEYGIAPFGDGCLAVSSVQGTNDTPIHFFGPDLRPDPTPFNGAKTGSYRGILVLGGN